MKKRFLSIVLEALLVVLIPACKNNENIKTLVVTNQGGDAGRMVASDAVNNILGAAGLFSTDILMVQDMGPDNAEFNPDFSKYELVVIVGNNEKWPEKAASALKEFVMNGGGLVSCNSVTDPMYGRPDSVSLAKRHTFEIRTLVADHPVTMGLPVRWLHPDDEILQGLKIGGEGSIILASAFSDPSFSGSGKPEPVIFVRKLGRGRIFVTMLGAPDSEKNKSVECAGYIATLQRGAEWAATGVVTQEVPFDFPTASGTVVRNDFKMMDSDEAFSEISSYEIGKSTLCFTWLQNEIHKAAGAKDVLSDLEKKMAGILENSSATADGKKLILKELSWMGSENCIPAIKSLESVPELKDEVEFALERLQAVN